MRKKDYKVLYFGNEVIHTKYGVCVVDERYDAILTPSFMLKPVTCEGRIKLMKNYGTDAKSFYENDMSKLRKMI